MPAERRPAAGWSPEAVAQEMTLPWVLLWIDHNRERPEWR